ncbi:MAG: hypothetical protein KBD06_01475 [Candidatus Pacebacteria bacterium]|nr:hypothetical protein [Candidatus Paceibacterota bacterium]
MNTDLPFVDIQETVGNPAATLDPIQKMLEPHVDAMIAFWFFVWVATAIVMLYRLWSEYRGQHPRK